MNKVFCGFAVATALMALATAANAGDTATDFANAGAAVRSNQIENLTGNRLTVHSLLERVVPMPVTVQGLGHQTVVVGNIIVNAGAASGSVLHAECPLGGGRVVVGGNEVVNLGYVGGGSQSTGVAVVNCPFGYGTGAEITGNQVTNLGTINQNH